MNAISAGDTAWVLTSTALVMVMTVGLAFFYGGLVRPKNALNTMMMSVVALGVVSVQWVLVGYSIAFGHGTPWWGGLAWLGFKGVGLEPDAAYGATIPLQAHAMFQLMFAIITPALISGAIVERMRFRAYVVFLLLWATFVYDPLAHWVWGSGGWLAKLGALDFAGGTVVHISAGVSALVAARMLGPRKDFKRTAIVPHNVPLVLLGAGLLWFGWFGFNAGSALAANGLAALAFTNTNTTAAMALVTWACLDLVRTGKITAVGAATGLVVGLVGITPAAGYITAPASLARPERARRRGGLGRAGGDRRTGHGAGRKRGRLGRGDRAARGARHGLGSGSVEPAQPEQVPGEPSRRGERGNGDAAQLEQVSRVPIHALSDGDAGLVP